MSHLHLGTQVVSSFDVPDYMLRAFTSNDAPEPRPLPGVILCVATLSRQLTGRTSSSCRIATCSWHMRPYDTRHMAPALGLRSAPDAARMRIWKMSTCLHKLATHANGTERSNTGRLTGSRAGASVAHARSGGARVKFRMSHPENAEEIVNGKDATWYLGSCLPRVLAAVRFGCMVALRKPHGPRLRSRLCTLAPGCCPSTRSAPTIMYRAKPR